MGKLTAKELAKQLNGKEQVELSTSGFSNLAKSNNLFFLYPDVHGSFTVLGTIVASMIYLGENVCCYVSIGRKTAFNTYDCHELAKGYDIRICVEQMTYNKSHCRYTIHAKKEIEFDIECAEFDIIKDGGFYCKGLVIDVNQFIGNNND